MNQALLLIAGYFGLVAVLSVAVIPYRRRLRTLGDQLLAEEVTDFERQFIEGMMNHAYSWRAAILLVLVYTAGLFQSGEALDRESEELVRQAPVAEDPRLHQMIDAYFASVIAVNPVFGFLAIIVRFTFRMKAQIHHSGKYAQRITDLRAITVPV